MLKWKCDRILIAYVHQMCYIKSEQVFIQTYVEIIYDIFFWCDSLATLSASTLRYRERTTSGKVTEPVVRDTQGRRNFLFT